MGKRTEETGICRSWFDCKDHSAVSDVVKNKARSIRCRIIDRRSFSNLKSARIVSRGLLRAPRILMTNDHSEYTARPCPFSLKRNHKATNLNTRCETAARDLGRGRYIKVTGRVCVCASPKYAYFLFERTRNFLFIAAALSKCARFKISLLNISYTGDSRILILMISFLSFERAHNTSFTSYGVLPRYLINKHFGTHLYRRHENIVSTGDISWILIPRYSLRFSSTCRQWYISTLLRRHKLLLRLLPV